MPTKAEINRMHPVPAGRTKADNAADNYSDFTFVNDGMAQVLSHLNDLLATPEPGGLLLNWFAKSRINAKEERLRSVVNYISQVKNLNAQYIDLQAQLYLNPEIVRGLILRERIAIKGELITAEQAIERQIADHKHYFHTLEHERNMRRLAEEAAQAEIAMKKAQARAIELDAQGRLLEAEARAARDKAKAAREMELVELMRHIRQNIKIDELPPAYQTFIAMTPFGSPLDAQQFEMAREIRDWFIRSEKAKAEQAEARAEEMKAGASSARTEAEYIKYKRDKSMRPPDV